MSLGPDLSATYVRFNDCNTKEPLSPKPEPEVPQVSLEEQMDLNTPKLIEDEDFGVSVIHMQRRTDCDGPIVMNFDKLMVAPRKNQLNTDDESSVASDAKVTEKNASRSHYEQFCTSIKSELFK